MAKEKKGRNILYKLHNIRSIITVLLVTKKQVYLVKSTMQQPKTYIGYHIQLRYTIFLIIYSAEEHKYN